MQDKPGVLFDELKSQLDDAKFLEWKESDVTTLLSLIGGYHRHQNLFGGEDESHSGMNGEYRNHSPAAIAAMDCMLTKLRRFLLERVSYETLSEPNAPPSSLSPKEVSTTPDSDAQELIPTKNTLAAPPVYPVDAFLYLEEDIDDLVQRGCIAREYCRACGATDIGLADFITHSFSQDQLLYISAFLLPALCDSSFAVQHHSLRRVQNPGSADAETPPPFSCKHVVDVGSRLGVVPLSCFFASQQGLLPGVERVTGIELDATFAALQRDSAARFASGASPALAVDFVHGDCFTAGAARLRGADVAVLHNVFEYFAAGPRAHLRAWQRLRGLLRRRGQLLVCSPGLRETFAAFTEAQAREVLGGAQGEREKGREERKRGRGDSKGAGTLEGWLDEWVEEVLVDEVREEFMKVRGCHGHEHTRDGDEGEEEGASQCDETEELRERLESIRVYVVR